MTDPEALARRVKALAREAGFDAVGVTGADAPATAPKLAEFLEAGRHGGMDWMAARADERADPAALWPEARSIIMLGQNYGPADDPLEVLGARGKGAISVYARGRDYHDVVKTKLKTLARAIVAEMGGEVKVFVDTAPVMEKPLAARAGVGWQGKHTNLVSRGHGSWLFLGAIFSTLTIAVDEAEADHCGLCRRCLDICPTAAFPAPYQLDARRCISYLTIEHKGPIPAQFREKIGNRVYGCDDCLAVCPWNKFASLAQEARLRARDDLKAPDLAELAGLDDAGFRARFSRSPIKRTGRDRFVRNVLIAIGNSGDQELAASASGLLDDPSPLVRGAAVWALRRLSPEEAAARRDQSLAREADADVRAEWTT